MSALDDFVGQCDSLAGTLPHFGERFAEMTRDTQDMAKQLEERMRFLEDGYEHLESVAGQIPEAFRQVASLHRKSMVDAAGVLDIEDKENEALHSKQMNYLKRELQSIAQERVIVDVFTRGTISRAKRHTGKQASGDGEAAVLDHDRSRAARIAGKRGSGSGLAGSSAVRASTDGANAPSLLQTLAPKAGDQLAHTQADGAQGQGQFSGNVFNRMTRSELMSTIHLPDFNPGAVNAAPAFAAAEKPVTKKAQRHSDSEPPVVRAIRGDAIIVPSMKQSLPEELGSLRTTPSDAISADDYRSSSSPGRRARQRKAQTSAGTADGIKSTIVPIAKALRAELKRNKRDMDVLRTEVHEAHKDMQAERVAARRVMQTVAAGLESRMASSEENIKTEVQAVVDGAFDRLTSTLLEIDGRRDSRYNRNDGNESESDGEAAAESESVGASGTSTPVAAAKNRRPASADAEQQAAPSRISKKATPKSQNPVSKYLQSQKGVQYDSQGRKVAPKSADTQRKGVAVQYDENGRVVDKNVPFPSAGAEKVLNTASALSPAPHPHSHPTPSASASSSAATSPRYAATQSPAGHADGSPRSKASGSPRAAESSRAASLTADAAHTAPVTAAHQETYVDPDTGTRYRVMGVSSRGYTGQRSVGQGPFWERRVSGKAAAATQGVASSSDAATAATASAGAASPVPSKKSQSDDNRGGERGAFIKSLSIYHPVPVPPSKEELQTEAERKAEEERRALRNAPAVRQEYSLVLTPSGVQWKATQIPVDVYQHPDLARGSGGEGATAHMGGLLRKESAPGDPHRPGLSSGSSGGGGGNSAKGLVTALGVVEGGGSALEIKGLDKRIFRFQKDNSGTTPAEDDEEIGALGTLKGDSSSGRGVLATGPLLAPPRSVGLPAPDIVQSVAVPARSKTGPAPAYGSSGYSQNAAAMDVANPAIGDIGTGFELDRAASDEPLYSFTSRVRAAVPAGSTPEKAATAAEAVTEDRTLRPVSAAPNAPVVPFSLDAGTASGQLDDEMADEVETVETFTGMDANNNDADDWEQSSEAGEVKLSSSALPEDIPQVDSLPPIKRPSVVQPTRLEDQAVPISSPATNAPPKPDTLVMQSLASPIGQQLVQRVPVLREAVAASAAAAAAGTATTTAAAAAVAGAGMTNQLPAGPVGSSVSMPAPHEFAAALIEAMRAVSASVAASSQVSAQAAAAATVESSVVPPGVIDDMRQQVKEGIEQGVRQALTQLKVKAAASKELRDKQDARDARAAAIADRAQRSLPSSAGAAKPNEAVCAVVEAPALPNQVRLLEVSPKSRASAGKLGPFVPLVSSVLGSQASMRAAALSLDSSSVDGEDSVDTIEQLYQGFRLAPGLEGLRASAAHMQFRSSAFSGAAALGPAPNSRSQSYIFAGGDVSSSDDWTEIGAGGAGSAVALRAAEDDELAILAELSLRDDGSFVEALRADRTRPSASAKPPSGKRSFAPADSMEFVDGEDGMESIPME